MPAWCGARGFRYSRYFRYWVSSIPLPVNPDWSSTPSTTLGQVLRCAVEDLFCPSIDNRPSPSNGPAFAEAKPLRLRAGRSARDDDLNCPPLRWLRPESETVKLRTVGRSIDPPADPTE
jgi:hypothetical protein